MPRAITPDFMPEVGKSPEICDERWSAGRAGKEVNAHQARFQGGGPGDRFSKWRNKYPGSNNLPA
jgi:hypothetical protein